MADENLKNTSSKEGSSETRQRSTISFPYNDLASAAELAKAIFANVGTGACEDGQLAAWTNQSDKSSTFRVQIYAARIFGIISGEGSTHKLTDLGLELVDPSKEALAKVKAFLNVPLYLSVYERFKSGTLPPAPALELEMIALGVAPKQGERARQVFERSAEQAGFFLHGRARLVKPGILEKPLELQKKDGAGSQKEEQSSSAVDPLVSALIKKIPPTGTEFTREARIRWLQMMEMALQDAYGEVTPISIGASVSSF
jgi:hypothetical protein